MGWVGLFIFIGVIMAIVEHIDVVLPIFLFIVVFVVICVIIKYSINASRESSEQKRILAEKAKAEKLRIIRERENEKQELWKLVNNAKQTTLNLQTYLKNAHYYLSRADHEFKEHAYMLFWENMASAMKNIQAFNRDVNGFPVKIRRYAYLYHRVSDKKAPNVLKISYSLQGFSNAIIRMKKIDRRAQKNPKCISIFLQMRTNSILMDILKGVTNMTDAIYNVGTQICNSIDNLADSFSDIANEFERSINRSLNSVADKLSNSVDNASKRQTQAIVKQERLMINHYKMEERELRSIRQYGINQGVLSLPY